MMTRDQLAVGFTELCMQVVCAEIAFLLVGGLVLLIKGVM